MAGAGSLRLDLVDVYGKRIRDTADITLRHRTSGEVSHVPGAVAARPILVEQLRAFPQGLYTVEVAPTSYLPASRFVNLKPTGVTQLTICLPINPDRVARVEFPSFGELDNRLQGVLDRSNDVLNHKGRSGEALYQHLHDEHRAGLLNIAAKSFVTPLKGGASLLPHVTLLDVRRDRCFVRVPRALRRELEDAVAADLVRRVDGSLHDPPEDFEPAGSFKTADAYGNLQLTLFAKGERCVADIDIDDAAGLGHVFQVLRNHLRNRSTHPYDIHEILVHHQALDPGYRLVPMKG